LRKLVEVEIRKKTSSFRIPLNPQLDNDHLPLPLLLLPLALLFDFAVVLLFLALFADSRWEAHSGQNHSASPSNFF
jgi:hypothetical protein